MSGPIKATFSSGAQVLLSASSTRALRSMFAIDSMPSPNKRLLSGDCLRYSDIGLVGDLEPENLRLHWFYDAGTFRTDAEGSNRPLKRPVSQSIIPVNDPNQVSIVMVFGLSKG
jgi:hypothetical protein